MSGYLVTKAIAAGVMLMASLLVLMGHGDEQSVVGIVPPVVAGVFLVATGMLLVADLKQPKRFWFLLTRGNSSSWLVRGAWVLGAFATCLAMWWVAGLANVGGALPVLMPGHHVEFYVGLNPVASGKECCLSVTGKNGAAVPGGTARSICRRWSASMLRPRMPGARWRRSGPEEPCIKSSLG